MCQDQRDELFGVGLKSPFDLLGVKPGTVHPPLPPNSDYFCDHDTFGPCFKIYNGYCNSKGIGPTCHYYILASIDEPDQVYMKPIISAVGDREWNREARRLRQQLPDGDSNGANWQDEANRNIEIDIVAADDNSSAWYYWGEKKL